MSWRRSGVTLPPAAAIGQDTPADRFLPSLFGPDEEHTRDRIHAQQSAALLGAIIAVALAARLLMAILIESPCNDSYFYFCIAGLLSNRQYDQAFIHLNLNTYPAILAVLHSWGIDWITAGKFWGVAVSTLTILPLFGWVRRLWGDRIALAASLLYAIHPELIELGVEPIREPTFWLFLATSLYAMTRGFQEQSFRFFCLAGLAMFLAIFTRTEGLVLLVVLGIGAVSALIKHSSLRQRLKTSFGVVICVSMTPLLLVAVNVCLLPDHPRWELGRLHYLSYLANVAFPGDPQSDTEGTPADTTPTDVTPTDVTPEATTTSTTSDRPADPAADDFAEQDISPFSTEVAESDQSAVAPVIAVKAAAIPPDKKLPARVAKFLTELNDVYGPHNLLFFLIGISICWRRRLLRRLVPMWIPMIVVMTAVWLRFAADSGGINGRYFLTMFFFVSPVLGIGLLAGLQMVADCRWKWGTGTPGGNRAATIATGLLAVVLIADAVTSTHRSREADLEIADTLVERYGPIDHVISDYQTTRVGFEIRRNMPELLAFVPLMETADRPGNNVVLVSTKCNDPLSLMDLQEWLTHLGYEANDAEYWSQRRKDLIVYTRNRRLAMVPASARQ